MGVPALFRWLSQKYPKIISAVHEEQPKEIDGHEVPVNTLLPNPNGEEFDNLYLDMNGIVHPCSHPEDRPPPATEAEMMKAIFTYTDRVTNMVRPRKLLLIAVDAEVAKGDGVAPRAKMNQQRSRRFRSAQEAKEKDKDNAEFAKMLKSQNGGIHELADTMAEKKTWDSNAITPGTPFMDMLAASLRYWAAFKVNTDPAWEKVKIIISDATVPGEGEHKIMEFIRSQRSSPEYNPNTRHVLYGLDADLIMLGLATHEPHFRVLREDVFFQESKARTCRICGQKGHLAEACRGEAKEKDGEFDEKDKAMPLKPFIWLHVAILREYLAAELHVSHQPFKFDLERALDDWVFMCFFVGNDFLPHLPSLDIRENGIDTLIAIWRDNIPLMGGYVTKDGHVDLERAQFILDGLAKQEDAIFKRRKETEDRREAGAKRRKLEQESRNNSRRSNGSDNRRKSPDYSTPSHMRTSSAKDLAHAAPDIPTFEPGKGLSSEQKALTYEMVVNRGAANKANQANKSAAAVLKSQLLNGKQADGVDGSKEANGDPGQPEPEHSADKSVAQAETPVSILGKRKADLMEKDDNGTPGHNTPDSVSKPSDADEPPPDHVRLWEAGYADRYYEQKFKVEPDDIAFRNQVAKAYVEGLAWVLLYYFQGCPSWTWYYPYHYAPFAADFVELDKMTIKFEKGRIFKPFEQLMGVMPAASNHTIPEVFRPLMSEEDSPIIDFYPTEFPIDLNGKKFAWQGVALLPFIDENRLLDAMATKYPQLSAEDVARNEPGKDALIMSQRDPLYEELASNFYSKRKSLQSFKLDSRISNGLAGKVAKNEDYIPQSSLYFPLDDTEMPSLEEDQSISVYFDMPRATYVHKSMLLRGLQMPPAVLDRTDIEATKGRASHSGRSFGGAPLRGGGGRGRGGHINYADQRPNPFAEHLNSGYGPPGGGYPGPPPIPHQAPHPNGMPPPRNGHYNGPPPPFAQGHYGGPPPPPQNINNLRGPPPPPNGFYGAPPPPPSGYYPPNAPPRIYQGPNNSYR